MKVIISCLGFSILTKSNDSWTELKQVANAVKFGQLYIDSIRPFLAMNTFLDALKQREKDIEYVSILKQVHGLREWIPKRTNYFLGDRPL